MQVIFGLLLMFPGAFMELSAPIISLVKVSDGKSIMCLLEDFYPETFSVKWKEDGRDVTGLDLPAGKSTSGLYTASSILQVTEEKWKSNVEYICEVTHNGQTYTEKRRFKGVLTVKITGPKVRELFINNIAVMECVISGDNEQEVEDAIVSWTHENIPDAVTKTDTKVLKTGQQYTKSNTLTFDQTHWFKGRKVKCSTTWRKKLISDEISIKKGVQKPTLLLYKSDEVDSQHVSFVCEVNGSPLGDMHVMWKKDDNPYIEGKSTSSVINKDNSMSVFSKFTVTKQEYDPSSTFVCVVKHAGINNTGSPDMKTISKSKSECPACPVQE